MPVSVGFITSRLQPAFDWFFDSTIRLQSHDIITQIIIVDYFAQICDGWTGGDFDGRRAEVFESAGDFADIVQWVPPMPNVWGGKYRLTKDSYWHKSAALNTALCLTNNPWFASTDDRCVLSPTWLEAVRDAMRGNYAVCGAYEKRHNLRVENGVITDMGQHDGTDPRSPMGKDHREALARNEPIDAPGSWWFGCSNALPLEWALKINGAEMLMDGLSLEDCVFGLMLENNGYPIKYDARFKVIQDRTPSELGPVMKRTSKERFPNDRQDKGHAALKRFGPCKHAQHPVDIRALRDWVLKGNPFPVPVEPQLDWYDAQRIDSL